MEPSLSGGEVAKKRALSATGEDRISALPDELLLVILRFVDNAAEAARTSVLSQRWRSVWTLLPVLRAGFLPEPLSFRRALTSSEVRLECLDLEGDHATVESLAIWLPAAARRLFGTLILVNHAPDPDEMPTTLTPTSLLREKKEKFFEMPCFENASTILLDLGFLPAFMPFSGVFAQLTTLLLERVRWLDGGACLIGGAWSRCWRCPCLQVLTIRNARGLTDVVINSESLLELELDDLKSLWVLSVQAAVLKKLTVFNCFFSSSSQLIRATVSAPRLEFLEWNDPNGQCCVELVGHMPHLQSIGKLTYFVHGPNDTPYNSACMKLLQPFKAIESLTLTLGIMKNIRNCPYLMEDMKVLPNPAILYLNIHANEHSFGASSFHVLRMCLGIKKLVLVNVQGKEKTPCLPGCVCEEQSNWKTEELLLINLQEIEIQRWRGSEHEVSFLKRLLNWATTLSKMTVTLTSSTTESNAKELFQMFKSPSKPGVCMKLMYHDDKKVLYGT